MPKQRGQKCTCINTEHTAIGHLYIFIFRCGQANCKDVVFDVFMVFWGFVHDALFVDVAVSHSKKISVEVNFFVTLLFMFLVLFAFVRLVYTERFQKYVAHLSS